MITLFYVLLLDVEVKNNDGSCITYDAIKLGITGTIQRFDSLESELHKKKLSTGCRSLNLQIHNTKSFGLFFQIRQRAENYEKSLLRETKHYTHPQLHGEYRSPACMDIVKQLLDQELEAPSPPEWTNNIFDPADKVLHGHLSGFYSRRIAPTPAIAGRVPRDAAYHLQQKLQFLDAFRQLLSLAIPDRTLENRFSVMADVNTIPMIQRLSSEGAFNYYSHHDKSEYEVLLVTEKARIPFVDGEIVEIRLNTRAIVLLKSEPGAAEILNAVHAASRILKAQYLLSNRS